MKSRKAVAGAGNTSKIGPQSGIAEEQTTKHTPAQEEIRQRAYEIHIERGGIHGCDLDDWLQAERELQEKYKNSETEAAKK